MKNFSALLFFVLAFISSAYSQNAESTQEISTSVQSELIYFYGAEVNYSKTDNIESRVGIILIEEENG